MQRILGRPGPTAMAPTATQRFASGTTNVRTRAGATPETFGAAATGERRMDPSGAPTSTFVSALTMRRRLSRVRATLDELVREGARRMIAAALEVEVEEYVRRFADEREENGQAKVVRNGRGKERSVTMAAGTVR